MSCQNAHRFIANDSLGVSLLRTISRKGLRLIKASLGWTFIYINVPILSAFTRLLFFTIAHIRNKHYKNEQNVPYASHRLVFGPECHVPAPCSKRRTPCSKRRCEVRSSDPKKRCASARGSRNFMNSGWAWHSISWKTGAFQPNISSEWLQSNVGIAMS